MKKKVLSRAVVSALILVLVLSFTACGQRSGENGSSDSKTSGDKTEYVIRLGHSDTKDNLLHMSLLDYAGWVEDELDGRVRFRFYPNEELGDNTQMAQMLVTGDLDAMMMPQGVEARYAPKIATLGLPFLFTSYEQAWAVMDDKEVAQGLTEGLKDYNLIQLAFWENGMRQITNSKTKVYTPEDVRGLKMRIPEDDMTEAIFKELGTKVTKFSWSRTYDALEQGTFDGQENPIANIYANKIQKVNSYMTITNHKYESKNLVFSLNRWDSLPDDVQKVLKKGAEKFGNEHRKAVASEEKKQLEKLKEQGMNVVEDPDIDAFKTATRDVYKDFEMQHNWTAKLVARIRELSSKVK